jgi:DNA-binding CsgD family transcriptional regulator
MRANDLNLVARAMYDAVGDPSKWRNVLIAMADALQSDHAIVGSHAEEVAPLLLAARTDEAHLMRLSELLPHSPYRRVLSEGPVATAFPDTDFMDYQELERSEMFQSVIRPMNGHHSLIGLPFRSSTAQAFVAVCRSQRRAWFDAEDQRAMQFLIPHASTALKLHSRLARADAVSWQRATVLDALKMGVILVDRNRRPVLLNARAEAFVRLHDGIAIERGVLRAATKALTARLHQSIAAAIDPHYVLLDSLSLSLARPSGEAPYTARIMPVTATDPMRDQWPSAAAVVFIDTPEGHRLRPDLLRGWFGFTQREAELAALIAEGKDLATCADLMRVGLETARTHFQGLFGKTHTRRQTELISVLLRTAWRL